MVSQQVCPYWLQWLPGGQISYTQCFVKHRFVYDLSHLRAVKYTSREFLHAYPQELSRRKANPVYFQSIFFAKFFITFNLICKKKSYILFGSTRGWEGTLIAPGFNHCLNSHSWVEKIRARGTMMMMMTSSSSTIRSYLQIIWRL